MAMGWANSRGGGMAGDVTFFLCVLTGSRDQGLRRSTVAEFRGPEEPVIRPSGLSITINTKVRADMLHKIIQGDLLS